MHYVIGLLGMLGFVACIVMLAVSILRKRAKRNWLIGIAICLTMFVVGVALTPTNENSGNDLSPQLMSTPEPTPAPTPEDDRPITADSFVDGISNITFDNPYYDESAVLDEDVPSMEDLDKYDEIMSKLSDYSRSEDEIMEKIAPSYNMTVEEIKDFMNATMDYATGFKKINDTNELNHEELMECAAMALSEVLKTDFLLSQEVEDWDISGTSNRYIFNTRIESASDSIYELILKIEFDRSYESFNIFQIKLDGINIQID